MFDTERLSLAFLRELCAEYGKNFDLRIMERVCGATPEAGRRVFIEEFGPESPDFSWAVCMAEKTKKLLDYIGKNGMPIKPGLLELLEFLKRREIPAAVASSSPADTVKYYIKAAGIEEYIAAYVSAEDVTNSKPAPDSFLAAAHKLGVMPRDCLVLEDSPRGLQAAFNAGMHSIWIPDIAGVEQRILDNTDAELSSLELVGAWIDRNS